MAAAFTTFTDSPVKFVNAAAGLTRTPIHATVSRSVPPSPAQACTTWAGRS